MKLKNTLILFIILVGLGGYVYLVEFKQHKKEQELTEEAKSLFAFTKDSTDEIYIENSNGSFLIKKIQGEWRITEPLYTEADEPTLNSMLTSLLGAKKDKSFSIIPSEISDYGLGERAVFVRLTDNEGTNDSIRFGDKTPVGSFVFCSKTDTLIYTTNENIKNSFNKKLFDIRFKKLMHVERSDIRKIVLRNRYGEFEFEKTGDNKWNILNINRPADGGKISSILSKLENNNAKEFVNEDGTQLSEYGLENPLVKINLQLGPEKGQKRFYVSRNFNGKYFAKDDSRKPIFEIDSAFVGDVNKKLSDFRDTDFADFERNNVDRVVLKYTDTLITCVKNSDDEWSLNDSLGQKIKQGKISSFLSTIDFTKISEFVKDGSYDPVGYGFNSPLLTVSLYDGDNKLLKAVFGKKSNDNIFAYTDKYESVYLIPASKLESVKLRLDEITEPVSENTEVSTGE